MRIVTWSRRCWLWPGSSPRSSPSSLVAAHQDESNGARGGIEAVGAIAVDGPSLFIWGTLLIFSIISVMLFAERHLEGGVTAFAGQAAALPGTEAEREASSHGVEHTEVFPLVMFAIGGMMLFPAANDLLTMFVALEVFSLPLYLLCGLARRRRLISQEAAMKYFLLGAFSSAFFLYGIALLYGFAGSFTLADIDKAVSYSSGNNGLLLIGMGLVAVGLLFKVSAAPFHAWTPDVYQGAPTAVTGVHGVVHEAGRLRCADADLLRVARRRPLGLAADDVDHRGARRWRSARSSRSPRPT